MKRKERGVRHGAEEWRIGRIGYNYTLENNRRDRGQSENLREKAQTLGLMLR